MSVSRRDFSARSRHRAREERHAREQRMALSVIFALACFTLIATISISNRTGRLADPLPQHRPLTPGSALPASQAESGAIPLEAR